jgi:hypothetical protein
MTFELEMALDILNGQIDKGVEFPEAIDRAVNSHLYGRPHPSLKWS